MCKTCWPWFDVLAAAAAAAVHVLGDEVANHLPDLAAPVGHDNDAALLPGDASRAAQVCGYGEQAAVGAAGAWLDGPVLLGSRTS